jgi:DNA primase small subunit
VAHEGERKVGIYYCFLIHDNRVWISTITDDFPLFLATSSSLPPTLEAALSILSSDFFVPIILEDQDCFRRRTDGWEVLLELIPDKEVRTRLEEKWAREAEMEMEDDEDEDERKTGGKTRSEDRWDDFKKEIKGVPKGTPRRVRFLYQLSNLFDAHHTNLTLTAQQLLSAAMEDIVLQYTYPRIDAEVSKHRNHLLKAPFCVHPGTGTAFHRSSINR